MRDDRFVSDYDENERTAVIGWVVAFILGVGMLMGICSFFGWSLFGLVV